MPASRAALTRCVCEECIEKGGYDERGAPKGVLMAERSISAHVRRVKAESAERAASTIAGKLTVSSITDDLSHLTLSMNPSQHPSFASSMNNDLDRPGPCNPPAVSVSVLSDNLEQLKLSDGMSVPPMTTSRQAASETASKPKHNRRTVKALNILDNIESRIQRCFRLSLHACSLDDAGRELSLLRTAMENVTGRVVVVIERKKAITTQIDDLAAQFGSHQDTLQGPVEINTGKS